MNIFIGCLIFVIGVFVGIALMCILQINRCRDIPIKVLAWISYDQANELIEKGILKDSKVGGMGGWFMEENRWDDYEAAFSESAQPYLEALRKEIINKNIKYCGNDHQELEDGVPVFNDNTVAMYSYRGWGDLMAAIWSTEENKDYSYMDFYMSI